MIFARVLNDLVSFFAKNVIAIVFKYHMSVTFRHYPGEGGIRSTYKEIIRSVIYENREVNITKRRRKGG